ncbi:putative tetratricopeptide-like helical domain superfamily, protein NPG1 [Helianthus annuus]|nr:putative tetratricopeptide-like helical domain superfamily, protein NPG1 [Helianthus annuus]KAJ0878119.1 putative tetratricopeptide-like helical domain superfamily, protein NPG1 [Helianthus annuus]KAJ0882405.1 putative tetratricopeptide-like helical domain superfamily [Helianthus annuus]
MQTLQVFFYLLIAEAAESCKVTLDIIESSLPDGLPENLDDQNPNCGLPLLLASKIHVENPNSSEGVMTAKRAIQVLKDKSDDHVGVGYYYLGVSLSACSRWEVTECKRVDRQHEALECLETAGRLTRMVDSRVLYDLSLKNTKQMQLDAAFGYAKRLLYLEGGSHVKGWMLLARILSAQKRFGDGESIIDAALDQTENWDHGELLRTKAKLQLAQGEVKRAIQTYTRVLAVLQVNRHYLFYGPCLFFNTIYSL